MVISDNTTNNTTHKLPNSQSNVGTGASQGGQIFHGRKFNVTPASRSIAVNGNSGDPFAKSSANANANKPETPKLPLHVREDLDPIR